MITQAGRYIARATKVELGETSNGDPQIVATFRVADGPDAGQKVTWFGFLFGSDQDKATKNIARCVESLRYMGFQGDDLESLESQILDNEVEIVVEMKPGFKDPSKVYPSVRFVNRIGGGGFTATPLDGSKRKRLSAELKSVFKSTPAEQTPAPVANGAKPVSGSKSPDDSVPF